MADDDDEDPPAEPPAPPEAADIAETGGAAATPPWSCPDCSPPVAAWLPEAEPASEDDEVPEVSPPAVLVAVSPVPGPEPLAESLLSPAASVMFEFATESLPVPPRSRPERLSPFGSASEDWLLEPSDPELVDESDPAVELSPALDEVSAPDVALSPAAAPSLLLVADSPPVDELSDAAPSPWPLLLLPASPPEAASPEP
ncbi:hypothetical protein [Gordonia paraffinivorans]|uniref:hypothetical protein n=1 Tax=Gordonia paraffinivorans TaxID=175628 RepID=UPI0014460240|nr:hypothetical protein [Gordonia paraffinivorans]